jgi:hypothetical protein
MRCLFRLALDFRDLGGEVFGVFPGQADGVDFCGFWLVSANSLNLAAMMTRRSLAVMSAVDGSAFVVYQGAARRRASASAGWWPAVAYQQTAILFRGDERDGSGVPTEPV